MKTMILFSFIFYLWLMHNARAQTIHRIFYSNSHEYSIYEWDKQEWNHQGEQWGICEFHFIINLTDSIIDTLIVKYPLENKSYGYSVSRWGNLLDGMGKKYKLSFSDEGLEFSYWDEHQNQHHRVYYIYHISPLNTTTSNKNKKTRNKK